MKRILFVFVPLLLAGVHAAGTAAPAGWSVRPQSDLVSIMRARGALEVARSDPGAQNLTLADALADFAGATARQMGSPTVPLEGSTALDLLGQAREIWLSATSNPALAERLWQRGRRDLFERQYSLALGELESALAVADRSAGEASPLALSIARDLVRVAVGTGKDPLLDTLAPRFLASLPADPDPLAEDNLRTYQALGEYLYRKGDDLQAESLLRPLLDQARAVIPQDAALVRRLTFELAGVLYGQLRYQEAQALVATLKHTGMETPREPEARKRTVDEMAARVRRGDLAGALALGQETLAGYMADQEVKNLVLGAAEAAYRKADAVGDSAGLRTAAAARAKAGREKDLLVRKIADIQGNVGEILHALGQLDAALEMYDQALLNYGPASLDQFYDVKRIEADMALVYRARGDAPKALALQQTVLADIQPLLGKDHPDVREAEDEIASLHLALKDYAAAAPLYAQKLERAEREKAAPTEIASILDAQATIALAQGDRAAAIDSLKRAAKLWSAAGSTGSAGLRNTQARLAEQRVEIAPKPAPRQTGRKR